MELEDFLELNLRAAITLYHDPRRRHLLEGEETVGGALALLLGRQLSSKTRKDDSEIGRGSRNKRRRKAGFGTGRWEKV